MKYKRIAMTVELVFDIPEDAYSRSMSIEFSDLPVVTKPGIFFNSRVGGCLLLGYETISVEKLEDFE